jgi:hypothetical protein
MAITVTLELPDAVVDRAWEAARRTGRSLEAVLADWLGQAAALDEVGFQSGATYPVITPYGNEAAAQALLDALAVDATRPAGEPR